MPQGYLITKLPDLPVVHVQYTVPRDDIEQAHREIAEQVALLLDGNDGKMYRINDFTLIDTLPIFSQVMRAMPMEVRGEAGTSSDPRVTALFVGQGQTVNVVAEGMRQQHYGGWSPKLFPTVDAALKYVRLKAEK